MRGNVLKYQPQCTERSFHHEQAGITCKHEKAEEEEAELFPIPVSRVALEPLSTLQGEQSILSPLTPFLQIHLPHHKHLLRVGQINSGGADVE